MMRAGLFGLLFGMAALNLAAAEPVRTIAVQGRATVERAPDIASVSVGVTTRAPQAAAALDANSQAAKRILEFARSRGVQPTDIQTSSVSLTETFKPRRDASGVQSQEPDGYVANNTVSVRLRDIASLGSFMRDVLGHGANRSTGVSFDLSDGATAADEVRRDAIEDAKRKARMLAEAAGATLGRVISIEYPPRAVSWQDGEYDMPRRATSASRVPIEAGVITLVAEIAVTWTLD